MENIIFGANVTDKETDATYNYYLYNRIDGFYFIMRETLSNDEWRFFIGAPNGDMATDWADFAAKSYARPFELSLGTRKYLIRSMTNFVTLSPRILG